MNFDIGILIKGFRNSFATHNNTNFVKKVGGVTCDRSRMLEANRAL